MASQGSEANHTPGRMKSGNTDVLNRPLIDNLTVRYFYDLKLLSRPKEGGTKKRKNAPNGVSRRVAKSLIGTIFTSETNPHRDSYTYFNFLSRLSRRGRGTAMENTNVIEMTTTIELAKAHGVSASDYVTLKTDFDAIKKSVSTYEDALKSCETANDLFAKAIANRDERWDAAEEAERAELADAIKKAESACNDAEDTAKAEKESLDKEIKLWNETCLNARLAYIADSGIEEWLRMPKVYRVAIKSVKAGDEKALIAYTTRVDLPLSQLPRNAIVDRMVQAIRADIRALYSDVVTYKGNVKAVDRIGLPDCFNSVDPLSNGRLAKMLLCVMSDYGMAIDTIHNGIARVFRDGAKTTTVKGKITERSIETLIDCIGYMAIAVNDGTPFTWTVCEN